MSRQYWAQEAQRFIACAVSAQFRCQDTASYKEQKLPDDGVGEQGQVKFIKRCLEFHGFQLVLLEEYKRQAMAPVPPDFHRFQGSHAETFELKRAILSSKRQRIDERKEDERDRDREGDENRGVDEQDVHHPSHAQTSDSSPYSCSNQIQSPQPHRLTCKWIGGISPEDVLRSINQCSRLVMCHLLLRVRVV